MSTVYTLHDTPEVLHRIRADLRAVTQTVRAGDPSLRSLILTGGFARGEGALRDGVPQNDYDFVAVRGSGGPIVAYPLMQRALERRLGVHIDLAPVQAWRLPWVSRSIFWYETAASGKILWGEHLLDRIRIKNPNQLDRAEGLRLLVNRAAGLLLVSEQPRDDAFRLQASKALLASMDAQLLAKGLFVANQTPRYQAHRRLTRSSSALPAPAGLEAWLQWAFRFKTDPTNAPIVDAHDAWMAARTAILNAIPVALRHAGLTDLAAYARRDGILDRLHYFRRSSTVPGASRLLAHPTGRVRVATLRLLEAAANGHVPPHAARRHLSDLVAKNNGGLALLEGLRGATLQ